MSAAAWRIDFDSLPGPDRKETGAWHTDHVVPAPDGRHAAALYSCREIAMAKEAGPFALLGGPPAQPVRMLAPARLRGLVMVDVRGSVLWLDGSNLLVALYGGTAGGRIRAGLLHLDLDRRRAGHAATDPFRPLEELMRVPMTWRSWPWLEESWTDALLDGAGSGC